MIRQAAAALLGGLFYFWAAAGTASPITDSKPPQAPPGAMTALIANLHEASERFGDGDNPGARDLLVKAINDPAFQTTSPEVQHFAYSTLAEALSVLGDDWPRAHGAACAATLSPLADGRDWQLRLESAYEIKDDSDSIMSLTTIASNWPGSLSYFSDNAIKKVVRKSQEQSEDKGYAVLEALRAAQWRPADLYSYADDLWFDLVRLRLEHGDQKGAAALAQDIEIPPYLVQMRDEKVFDPIVEANPSHFDVIKAIERELEATRALAAAQPDHLQGINLLADYYIGINRPNEALEIIDAALARTRDKDKKPFVDFDGYVNWTLNDRSRALVELGRMDEGVHDLEAAARTPENGAINVSQVINLADTYVSAGRPQEALTTLSFLGLAKPTDYGRMAAENARGCAYALLRDQAGLAGSLNYIRAHVADGPKMAIETLLCADDIDGAAKVLIAQLDNPKTRTWTLYSLQDFAMPPSVTPVDMEAARRWRALRDRPDVTTKISMFGRIGSYPITSPGY